MYVKVFEQIYDSSIVENWQTRFVFLDLLVLADRDGIVDATHESIARRTNVPIEVIRSAISELEQPDLKSRSPAFDGRRIVRLDEHRDWGWRIVNYGKYREIRNKTDIRDYEAERKRKYRSKNKIDQIEECPGHVPDVSGQDGTDWDTMGQTGTRPGTNGTPASASEDAEALTVNREYSLDSSSSKQTRAHARTRKLPRMPPTVEQVAAYCTQRNNDVDPEAFVAHYTANGWVQGRGKPIVDWRAAVITFEKNQHAFGKANSGNGSRQRSFSNVEAALERLKQNDEH